MQICNVPYCASGSKTHPNTLAGKINLDILARKDGVVIGVSVPGHFFTCQYRLEMLQVARLAGYLDEYLKTYMPTRVKEGS